MKGPPNYYAILGISSAATQSEIRVAAERLGSQFSADMHDPAGNVAYRQLLTAYDVLSNPEKRASYDAQLTQLSSRLLQVNLMASRQTIGPEQEHLLYLLTDIRPPEQKQEEKQAVNICLVIDRSTSMRGERLDRVKAATRLMVEKLSGEDVISIVTFSDRAELVCPAGFAQNRNQILARLSTIMAGGGTEIYQGLKAGVRELTKVTLSKYVNQLILLTDGHTYGDEEECLKLAGESAGRGISFSAFGIGGDWNDKFLDQLVAPASGHSAYIENPADLIRHLNERIQGLSVIYAQDVHLALQLPENVSLKYAMKMTPFAQPLTGRKHDLTLGSLEGRAPLSVLLELVVRPQFVGQVVKIPLKFTANIPSHRLQNYEIEAVHEMTVVTGVESPPPPQLLVRAVQMLNLYRMNEQVWDDVEAGRLEVATSRIKRLTSRLEEAGHSQLAQQARLETQRLAHVGTMSLEGRKKLKYGTRSLLTKTMKLVEHD